MNDELFNAAFDQMSRALVAWKASHPDPGVGEEETFARAKADEIIVSMNPDLGASETSRLCDTLIDYLLGVGPLQPLIDDTSITNIEINGYDRVFIREKGSPGFRRWEGQLGEDDEELKDLVRGISARMDGGEWTSKDWRINLKLPDGSRLHGVQSVTQRPVVTIRKHDHTLSSLRALVAAGSMPSPAARLLANLVRGKANIVVSGGTNSGKTTLLRALLNVVPASERIITAEDIPELAVGRDENLHPNVAELETVSPNLDGKGGINLTDIMRETLRMNPDRVIVGEIRGKEITEMVRAMSQGNDGSMCSIHADSAIKAVSRLVRYYGEGGASREDAHSAIGDAVDFIIHLGVRGGRRALRQVVDVGESDPSGKNPPRTNPILDDSGGVWRVGMMNETWAAKLDALGFSREEMQAIHGQECDPQ